MSKPYYDVGVHVTCIGGKINLRTMPLT